MLKWLPICACGFGNEDVFHYLFKCPLYDNQRQALGQRFNNYIPLTAHKLSFGDTDLSNGYNETILLAVQKYISKSKKLN